MGFREFEFPEKARERQMAKEIHPVWRGVGCVMAIALAVGGYFAAEWFLQANAENGWIYLPPQVFRPPYVPAFVPPGAIAKLVVALITMVMAYGVISFLYAVFFPPKLGETDAPPIRRRRRRRR